MRSDDTSRTVAPTAHHADHPALISPHTPSRTPSRTQSRTPITRADALAALLDACGDHRLVRHLCQQVDHYETLCSWSPAERAGRVGAWAVQMRLPATLPARPVTRLSSDPHGPEIRLVGFADRAFPARLRTGEYAPALIELAGRSPDGPLIGIGGTRWPSANGWQAAVTAADTASRIGARVVAAVDGGLGEAALQRCIERRAPAVAVTGERLSSAGRDDLLLEQVLTVGGTVLHVYGSADSDTAARQAAGAVASLSDAIVLAELGLNDSAGAVLARAAVAQGTYLIVPSPEAELLTPLEAAGGRVLAHAQRFSSEWFGTSARIDLRVNSGRSAADAVVATVDQLADAMRWGVGLTPQPATPQPVAPTATGGPTDTTTSDENPTVGGAPGGWWRIR